MFEPLLPTTFPTACPGITISIAEGGGNLLKDMIQLKHKWHNDLTRENTNEFTSILTHYITLRNMKRTFHSHRPPSSNRKSNVSKHPGIAKVKRTDDKE